MTGVRVLKEEIREALGRGAVVVTGNERAARTLRREYDEVLRANGRERWEPGKAMSWTAWTGSLWRRMLLDGQTWALLLNNFQEHAVWRSVLAGDEAAQGIRGADELAGMAAEAWARMCAYARVDGSRVGRRERRISARLHGGSGSADTVAFAQWARAFENRCAADGLVTMAELDGAIAEAVRAGELRLEADELMLVGFDRMTPSQEHLLEAWRDAGIAVSHAPTGVEAPRRYVTEAIDGKKEVRSCARWAAAWMDREPGARIAVIVPELAAERAGIERMFREVLAPELESIAADEAIAPYEFSLGRALAETPMVWVGLELLRWAGGALPLDRVSALLVSKYFAGSKPGGGEREVRAEWDAYELRRAGMLRPEISLEEMARRVAGSKQSRQMQEFSAVLGRMARRAAEFGGIAQGYGGWAQRMRELLAEAGWGVAGAETSEEFQARERWESALDAMSTLDFEDRAVEYASAMEAMERIARETVFAPESRSAAVQVMGPMEAAGGAFDAVWLLRAGEMSWPPVAAPLALLPWGLQRDLGMPGTDTVRDLAEAKQLTERILTSGREVVASSAKISGEVRQRMSAMVRGMAMEETAIDDVAGPEPERTVMAVELTEDNGAIRPLPDEAVRGGVRVLELQAACGFRAFAEQRLSSSELESRRLGLNARESGTAVHKALESFWAEVQTQAALLAMTPGEQREALSRAIEAGLPGAGASGNGPWDGAYLDMQRERLRRLLDGWMEAERRRPAFEVTGSEQKLRDVEVGPLRFQLRIDRVDVVKDALVLIDYKTGAASPAEWTGERPDAPQLPMYAILAARGTGETESTDDLQEGSRGPELGAVAFANVRLGKEARLRGYAAREGLLPGKASKMEAGTFAAQVELWKEVLERLAEEFAAGDAPVRPKVYPGTCARCGQRMLCRLDASLLGEIEEDGVEAGGEGEDG